MRVCALLALLCLAGCASRPVETTPPLPTSGDVAPPPGCVDLRARGGSC